MQPDGGRWCWCVLGLLLAGAASCPAQTGQPREPEPQTSGPQIELSTTHWDFGEKWTGQKAETKLRISNVGDRPLRIKNISTDCACMVAELGTRVLAPGQSAEALVSYRTLKPRQRPRQQVRIYTNDPDDPVVTVLVTGHVRKVFNINIGHALAFGVLGRQQQAEDSVEIKVLYDRPVRLELQPAASDDVACRLEVIEPGRRYRFVARTKPPLAYGPLRLTTVLKTDLDFLPELKIRVTGYVQPPVEILPRQVSVPASSRRRAVRVLRLTSRRKGLEITRIETSRPDVEARLLGEGGSRQAGGVKSLLVRVELPPADKLRGQPASITIHTNDPDFATIVVPIVVRGARTTTQPARPAPDAADN